MDASITYDGCYQAGKKVTFPVNVSSTMIESLNKKDVTFLEFNGNIGNQKIKYSISEYNPNKITGIYQSNNPDDTGSIDIYPSEKKKIDYGTRNGMSWCVIF